MTLKDDKTAQKHFDESHLHISDFPLTQDGRSEELPGCEVVVFTERTIGESVDLEKTITLLLLIVPSLVSWAVGTWRSENRDDRCYVFRFSSKIYDRSHRRVVTVTWLKVPKLLKIQSSKLIPTQTEVNCLWTVVTEFVISKYKEFIHSGLPS